MARPLGMPARARAALYLVLLATASAACLAGPAAATHKDLRFGLQSDAHRGELTNEEFARIGGAGTDVLRIEFSWRRIDQGGGVYDWMATDRLVYRATQQGMSILPILLGSPPDVAPAPSFPPNSASDLDRWQRFLKAVVERYGRDGRFWCQSSNPFPRPFCSDVYRPIVDFQVWNEPSLDNYWYFDPSPREYADLLELSRKALESRDEDANVVLAGMPVATNAGIDLKPYLRRLYEVNGIKKEFDVVAVHPYAEDVDGVDFALGELRDQLDGEGDENTPIWVTEFGWATGGDPNLSGGRFFIKSPEGQARQLRKTFELFQEKRARYELGTTIWYSFRDSVPDGPSDDWWTRYTGLFTADGDPKPSWQKFVNFTGGAPGDGPLEGAGGAAQRTSTRALESPDGPDVRPAPAK